MPKRVNWSLASEKAAGVLRAHADYIAAPTRTQGAVEKRREAALGQLSDYELGVVSVVLRGLAAHIDRKRAARAG